MKKIQITLVISSLSRGGAERVMCMLASSWARQGKEVTLLKLDHGEPSAYSIHPGVNLRSLGLLAPSKHPVEALLRNWHRVVSLRRAIRKSKPDVVISFMDTTNILTLFATRRLHIPTVVCEHVDPRLNPLPGIWGGLRRLLYPHAQMLVCLTDSTLARFQAMGKIRSRVIPNPIAPPPQGFARRDPKDRDPKQRILVAMGRLVQQKGFDILLDAFALIAHGHPEWSLKILGEGPLREDLQSQARALNLAGRVAFTGEVSDPYSILGAADLFVLSSRFEGFGLALCEAMASGLPVVSFDCPAGPGDIICHGVDGILVPAEDTAALAKALDRLMGDDQERARLASRAPEVLFRFSSERVLALWDQLFADILPLRETSRSHDSIPHSAEPGV